MTQLIVKTKYAFLFCHLKETYIRTKRINSV